MTPLTGAPAGRSRSGLLGVAIALTVINLVLLVVVLDWGHGVLTGVAEESDNEAADRAAEQLSEVRGRVFFGLRLAALIALPILILLLVRVGIGYSRAMRREQEAMELRSYYRKSKRKKRRSRR